MERYEKESFRRSMRLKLDFNNMMTRMVGENGVSEEDLLSLFMQISDAEEAMKEKRAAAGILSQPMKLCEKIEPETLQDHQEFIAGAAYMEDQCQEEDTFRNIGYMFAIMKYIAKCKGRKVTVIVSADKALEPVLAAWDADAKVLDLAEQMMTEDALLNAGKLSMVLTVPEVNDFTMGELMHLYKVASDFARELENQEEGGSIVACEEVADSAIEYRPKPEARFII